MANELAVVNPYAKVKDVENFISTVGKDITASGMFGCQSFEQGRILALECLAKGVPPLSLAEGYHLIYGKLAMKASKMLSNFEERGGKCRVIQRTADIVSAQFTIGSNDVTASFTWEEALQEPFVYEGREPQILAELAAGRRPALKAKYQTPRSRMQMLWARLVSDTIGAICASAKHGAYTPEEVADFDEYQTAAPAAVVSTAPPAAAPVAAASLDENVEDVSFEPAEAFPPVTPESEHVSKTEQIRELYHLLSIPFEKQQDILAKRGVSSLMNLTPDQADELISKLTSLLDASKAPAEAVAMPVSGPALQTTIDAIKAEIRAAEQTGMQGVAQEISEKLKACGMQRLADLSEADGQSLLKQVQIRNLADFFAADLQKAAAN